MMPRAARPLFVHRAQLLIAAARVAGTLRALGDVEGHPFHGNQWTGSVGGGWTMVSGHKIVGHNVDRVKNTLTKIPKHIRDEAPKATFNASDTQAAATEKIDAYLMKHYGITSEGQAIGLVDREKKQVFSVADDENVMKGFAHLLEPRIESDEWKKATPGRTGEQREDDFVNAFAGLVMGRHGQEIMSMSNPLTAILEREPVMNVLKKWRWAEDGTA
jgi:hypothetical protein